MRPPQPPATDADVYDRSPSVLSGPEITDALAGRYGAATRISKGQQSVTLYSAIPIMEGERVAGAVIVSQSTWRILSDLYALRLDIFQLFLWSLATSLVLSFLLSATVTVPLRRLRDQAHGVLDAQGRLAGTLVPVSRRDEIGDLSRSLGILTEKLARHITLVETFASDVSHELKNPLASIRSALELAQTEENARERAELLSMAMGDISRMEKLLAGVREISRIDSGTDAENGHDAGVAPDVRHLAEGVGNAMRLRSSSVRSDQVRQRSPALGSTSASRSTSIEPSSEPVTPGTAGVAYCSILCTGLVSRPKNASSLRGSTSPAARASATMSAFTPARRPSRVCWRSPTAPTMARGESETFAGASARARR